MRKLQLIKYAAESHCFRLLLLSIILPVVFVSTCLYYLIFKVLAEDLGIPEAIAEHLLPVIQKINGLLLVGLPLMVLMLVGWGLIIFTRLIGPIGRMKRELDGIISGDYSLRIKLRKGDDLLPVANGINTLLDKIQRIQEAAR